MRYKFIFIFNIFGGLLKAVQLNVYVGILCQETVRSSSFLIQNLAFSSFILFIYINLDIIQNLQMKKNQIYRLCLKAGHFQQTPVFRVKVGKFEKTVNTYFIPSDKQRYNYDVYFQKNKQPEIMIEVFANKKLIGTGVLKFDASKPQMPNQNIDIMDNKQKIGVLQCSLKKIQKKNKKPPMKIRIVQASYEEDLDNLTKMDPFIVIKYADNNYKTNFAHEGGKTPVWKQQFNIGTADNDRVFVESWQEDQNGSQFIGVSIIDIPSKLGAGQIDVEVIKDKKKQGMIKIELMEHTSKRPDQSDKQINDKNYMKKRNIKTYAVEAVMKEEIKKGGFIKIQIGQQEHETTPIFKASRQLKWNQAFSIKCSPGEEMTAILSLKDQIEEEVGRCMIKVDEIGNKKYELSIINAKEEQIGKLYLQFYDQELDVSEQINDIKKMESEPAASVGGKQKPVISQNIESKINSKNIEIKQRYANRQSIHDYMAEVNAVLQQGLLMVAKERPQDPIKHLGLFLINYKK